MPAFLDALPTMNASFNALSAMLVLAGWRAIRRKDVALHRRCMMGAILASAFFFAGYITRLSFCGVTRFEGEPGLRAGYLILLAAHTSFAIVTPPLVGRTVFLALKDRIPEHVRLVKWTLPIWLWVSFSGIAVYVMLYHVSGRT